MLRSWKYAVRTMWGLLLSLAFTLPAMAQEDAKPPPAPVVKKASMEKVNCGPQWPRSALRKEQTGTVTLAFFVNADSVLVDSKVTVSSGVEALDEAALVGLRKCKFHASTVDGKAVESWFSMQYVWTRY